MNSFILIHAESAIVDKWLESFPAFEKESLSTEKGITILRKKQ